MSDFKENINKITSSQSSKWKERVLARKQKPWMKEYSYKIAQTILYMIKKKGSTQEDLAKKLDVSPQRISTIVKGRENLTLEVIYNLSKELGVELISFPEYEDTATTSWSIAVGRPIQRILSLPGRTIEISDLHEFEHIEKTLTKGQAQPTIITTSDYAQQ